MTGVHYSNTHVDRRVGGEQEWMNEEELAMRTFMPALI